MKRLCKALAAIALIMGTINIMPVKAANDYKFRVEVASGETTVYGNVDADYNAEFVFPKVAVIDAKSATMTIKMKDVAGLGITGEKVFSKKINTGMLGNIELNDFNINTYGAIQGMSWWNWNDETLTTPIQNFENATVSGTIGGKAYSYALAANHDANNWKIEGTPSKDVPMAWAELVKHITTTQGSNDSKIVLKSGTYIQIGTEKLTVNKDFDIDNLPNLSEEAIRDVLTLDTNAKSTGHQMQISMPKGTELKLGSTSAVLKDDAVVTVDGMNEMKYFNTLLSNLRSVKELNAIKVFGTVLDVFYHGVKGVSGQNVKVNVNFPNAEVVVDSVTLDRTEVILEKGKQALLTATIQPTNATNKDMTWKTSNKSVATVDDNGKVTAVNTGTTDITVKTTNGKIATTKVTVYQTPVIETPKIDTDIPVKDVTVGVNDKTAGETLKDITDAIINGDFAEYTTVEVANKVNEAILNNKTISTQIVITNLESKEVTKEDANLVKKAIDEIILNGKSSVSLAQYLDISVLIKANEETLGTINLLDKSIQFTIALPKDMLKEGRDFYIVRIHDGVSTIIETELEGNSLTFSTDKFSTYAIVYEDKAVITPEDPTGPSKPVGPEKPVVTPGDDAVKTDDSSLPILYIALLGTSLVILGATVYKNKKKI